LTFKGIASGKKKNALAMTEECYEEKVFLKYLFIRVYRKKVITKLKVDFNVSLLNTMYDKGILEKGGCDRNTT